MDVGSFHKRLKELYLPPENEFTLVDVPEIRYAAIDGEGDPADEVGRNAVKWLYSLVHIVKPIVKEKMDKNFVEPPLEYLYWAEDMNDFIQGKKDQWRWRIMIVFVDWITDADFSEVAAQVSQKLGPAPSTLQLVNLHEGKCVQTMQAGDYLGIAQTCDLLYHSFLPENNLRPNGHYHEIYLNDPARTAPAKRRMVVRQPVKKMKST